MDVDAIFFCWKCSITKQNLLAVNELSVEQWKHNYKIVIVSFKNMFFWNKVTKLIVHWVAEAFLTCFGGW